MWRTLEGQAETLRFDEVGRRESMNVIKEKNNMKLVFEGN